MDCREFQEHYLRGNAASIPEAGRHLDECRECRDFVRLCGLVTAPQPSGVLDEKVKQLCHGEMRLLRRRRRWLQIFQPLAGLAATLAIAAGAAWLYYGSADSVRPLAANSATAESYRPDLDLAWDSVYSISEGELDTLETDLAILALNY